MPRTYAVLVSGRGDVSLFERNVRKRQMINLAIQLLKLRRPGCDSQNRATRPAILSLRT